MLRGDRHLIATVDETDVYDKDVNLIDISVENDEVCAQRRMHVCTRTLVSHRR